MVNNKNLERSEKSSRKEKKLPACVLCKKGFTGCIVIGNYHPECFEIKKEKEVSPYLFSKVEQLETDLSVVKALNKDLQREIMVMKNKKS